MSDDIIDIDADFASAGAVPVPHDHTHAPSDIASANEQHFDSIAHTTDDRPSVRKLAKKLSAAVRAAHPFDEDTTTVLDFACGTGAMSRALAAHAKALVGVDISQGMVDVYNARVANQGIAPEEMRAVRAELRGEEGELGGAKFDVVVCSMAYHHFVSISDISRVLAFFLKPGGQLMVADITRMTDGGELIAPEYHHIVPHTAGLSEADMRAAFEGAGLREFSFEKLAPGKMHGGAVDFFFARATKPV